MTYQKYLVSSVLAITAFGALLLCDPVRGFAAPLLGPDLASFAVLGATPSVTNTGATTLTGDVGVSPAASITGQATLTVNGINALSNPGHVHLGDATAGSAQTQLGVAAGSAIFNLGLLGPGSLEPANLVGLTLPPGVYTVPAGMTNLSGTLTLDGGGNANAAWVFQMESTLITSSGSVVNVINTGAGAGVYWNVRSDATLGATTSFEGNILALNNITLVTGATIGCGRALAHVAQVIMDANTINSVGCEGTGEEGSKGLSGGLDVTTGPGGTVVAFLPFAPVGEGGGGTVPEPSSLLLLLCTGLAGLVFKVQRRKLWRARA